MTGISGIEIKDKEDRNVLQKKTGIFYITWSRTNTKAKPVTNSCVITLGPSAILDSKLKKSKNQTANKSNMIKEKRKESEIA